MADPSALRGARRRCHIGRAAARRSPASLSGSSLLCEACQRARLRRDAFADLRRGCLHRRLSAWSGDFGGGNCPGKGPPKMRDLARKTDVVVEIMKPLQIFASRASCSSQASGKCEVSLSFAKTAKLRRRYRNGRPILPHGHLLEQRRCSTAYKLAVAIASPPAQQQRSTNIWQCVVSEMFPPGSKLSSTMRSFCASVRSR